MNLKNYSRIKTCDRLQKWSLSLAEMVFTLRTIRNGYWSRISWQFMFFCGKLTAHFIKEIALNILVAQVIKYRVNCEMNVVAESPHLWRVQKYLKRFLSWNTLSSLCLASVNFWLYGTLSSLQTFFFDQITQTSMYQMHELNYLDLWNHKQKYDT